MAISISRSVALGLPLTYLCRRRWLTVQRCYFYDAGFNTSMGGLSLLRVDGCWWLR